MTTPSGGSVTPSDSPPAEPRTPMWDPDDPPTPQQGREHLAVVLHECAIGCWYDSHHVRYCEPDYEHHAKHADRLIVAGVAEAAAPDAGLREAQIMEVLGAWHGKLDVGGERGRFVKYLAAALSPALSRSDSTPEPDTPPADWGPGPLGQQKIAQGDSTPEDR